MFARFALENLEPRLCLSITDPDLTFGSGGAVTLPFVPDLVSVEPDGKILAVKAPPDTGLYSRDTQIDVAQIGVNGSLNWRTQVPVGNAASVQIDSAIAG